MFLKITTHVVYIIQIIQTSCINMSQCSFKILVYCPKIRKKSLKMANPNRQP